jgi:hypothetical protein
MTGLSPAEVYDPVTGVSSLTGPMIIPRIGHQATLLQSGDVLISGGVDANDQLVGPAEIYHFASGTWSLAGTLNASRSGHVAVGLPTGKVLVAGGLTPATNTHLTSAELYDPATGVWKFTSSNVIGGALAVLLSDGRALVVDSQPTSEAPPVSQIFDASTETWSPKVVVTGSSGGGFTPSQPTGLVRLRDRRVLLVWADRGTACFHVGASLFDPAGGVWVPPGSGGASFDGLPGMAVVLPDGRALLEYAANCFFPSPAAVLFRPDNTTARLAVAPTALDLGNVAIGASGQQTVSVQNTGETRLAGSVGLGNATGFSVVSGANYILGPGVSSPTVIGFSASAFGAFNGVATFMGDGGWVSVPVKATVGVMLSGRVTGSGGTGLPSITVELHGATSASTTTDAGGAYAFFVPPNTGLYVIVPANPSLTFTPSSQTVFVNTANIGGLDFVGTTPVPGFDYALSNTGGITVPLGGGGTTTIAATLVSGSTQPVTFATSGLPSGVTGTFSLGSCSPTCTSTLTLTVTPFAQVGTFPVTVTGNPLGRATAFTLVVVATPPPFDYALSTSGAITVTQGSSGTGTITATLQSGTAQTVTFSASGLPAGATAAFSPGACSPSCTSTLTITTTGATPPGTFPIAVTGSPLGHTTTFNLVVNPPSGSLVTHIGVFRNASWSLDLNGNRQWEGCGQDGPDGCPVFGIGSDRAMAGDWTGTGHAKIGVFRDSQWYLDLNGNGVWDGCDVDACFGFGIPSDQPVVGDWTGTGTAKIGIFRGGVWSLDRNGNGVWDGCIVDACPTFGTAGDVAVVGKWPGATGVNIGVFRGGVWFLDLNGNAQWDGCEVDACIAFGAPEDLPVVGDWTGTGHTNIGVFRNGVWYLDLNGNGQWDGCAVDACIAFGMAGDQPVAGNW